VNTDFSLNALYDALDAQRQSRGLTWTAVMREINRNKTYIHPIATSTITSLKDKAVAEGDGILQMLLWLGRSPESFISGFADANDDRFQLQQVARNQTLRWDAKALHGALNAQREARGMTWKGVAQELGGFTPAMLTNLSKGGRAGFPGVMRIVLWLGQPAATFTRAKDDGYEN
jgi:hypothetical protein